MISALFALAAAAAAAQAQPPAAVVDWLRRPSAQNVANAYPLKALRQAVSGRAEIECLVGADGKVFDCKVVSEEPAGFGFGDATLRLASTFQMRPGYEPENPVRPRVDIPVRFIYSPDAMRRVTELEYPAWIAAPTFEDVARAYPVRGGGSTGFVTLECPLDEGGAVTDGCEPQSETPKYKDFDRSARTLARLFRVDPKSDVLRQGKSLWVKLNFRFPPADSDDMLNRRISAPRWIAAPTPDDVRRRFPAQAEAKGVKTGRGVASCRVAADGSMSECKPLPGDPDGLGFSEAAVAIATTVRMAPWTNGGGPVNGAVVDLPIQFDLTEAAPAP